MTHMAVSRFSQPVYGSYFLCCEACESDDGEGHEGEDGEDYDDGINMDLYDGWIDEPPRYRVSGRVSNSPKTPDIKRSASGT